MLTNNQYIWKQLKEIADPQASRVTYAVVNDYHFLVLLALDDGVLQLLNHLLQCLCVAFT